MKKVKVANKDTGDLVGGQLEVEEIPGWRPDRRQLVGSVGRDIKLVHGRLMGRPLEAQGCEGIGSSLLRQV